MNVTVLRDNRPIVGASRPDPSSASGEDGMAARDRDGILAFETTAWAKAPLASVLVVAFAYGAAARTVCVRCADPVTAFRCEIEKSDKIESLPFGRMLVERACIKSVKKSVGARKCRTSEDDVCGGALAKTFSLEDAKKSLLGEEDAKPANPVPSPSGSSPEPQEASVGQPPPNALWQAWRHFLRLLAWQ
jgi:hypothetical protein